jgi:hypothetical protein
MMNNKKDPAAKHQDPLDLLTLPQTGHLDYLNRLTIQTI